MTKKTQNDPQPQPSNTATVEGQGETGSNVTPIAPTQSGDDYLRSIRDRKQSDRSRRAQLEGTVRQRLAEVADLTREEAELSSEAASIASEAASKIWEGLREGLFDRERANAILGDVFGFMGTGKAKGEVLPAGHPNAGKTPAGTGQVIRKRLTRLEQAAAFVEDGEATAFFDGLPESDVENVLHRVETGATSIWSAYSELQEMRKELNSGTRIPVAFNPDALGKMLESLSHVDQAAAAFVENEALAERYADLQIAIQAVSIAAAKKAAKAA